MADGAERIQSRLSDAVNRTHAYAEYEVGASSSARHAGGSVGKDLENGDAVVQIEYIAGPGTVRLDLVVRDLSLVGFEDALDWAKAVWDGAESKGFPTAGWKY